MKERLELICNKVPKCKTLADIGTDHGYVVIELLRNSVCKKAFATDIKTGPLNIAKKNAYRYGVLDKLEIRQGDGLEPFKIKEADVFVIAGMGGLLISEIINKGFDKAKNADCLILQPMNAMDELRTLLYSKGFDIYDEQLCTEDERIYNVICAKYDGIVRLKNIIETYIGEKLVQKEDPLLTILLKKRINTINKIIDGLNKAQNTKSEELQKLRDLLNGLENLLLDYK